MIHHDQNLQELQEKVARKRKLEAMLNDLEAQHSQLSLQVQELDRIRVKEQADVDKLEGGSLASFFYNVIGKMDQQLDREREEAYAAAVKYDAAARELQYVEADLERCSREYRQLQGVEGRYAQALQDKLHAVKAAGGETAQQILQLETSITVLKNRQKETREAIAAGNAALDAASAALKQLEKAGGLATWDMFGGGLLVDMAKHDALDTAQSEVEQLQERLRRFKTELADINWHTDFRVNLDGFTRFADYFFDGLFMDWSVADKISKSESQVQRICEQLENLLSRLQNLVKNLERQMADAQKQIDQLIVDAKV